MPNEFDPDTAMGLAANIPAIEAHQTLAMARAVAIVFGDAKSLARAVYESTGSAKLAQRVEIQAQMQKAMDAQRT
jgi:hypothetical protein